MKKITITIETTFVDGSQDSRGRGCENYFTGLPPDVSAMLNRARTGESGVVSNAVDFLEPGEYVISISIEKKTATP